MKKHLLISKLIFSLVSSVAFAGGNGSSGTGNKQIALVDGLQAQVADDQAFSISAKGDRIVDGKTGEPLFDLDHVNMASLTKSSGEFVGSQMGEIRGFEHVPNGNLAVSIGGDHYWLICQKDRLCLRMTPLSQTNPKVDSMVGALRQVNSK